MNIPNATISWVIITDPTRTRPTPNHNPTIPNSNSGNLSAVVFFYDSSNSIEIIGQENWTTFFGKTGPINIQPGQCWGMSLIPDPSIGAVQQITIPYTINNISGGDNPTMIVVTGGK